MRKSLLKLMRDSFTSLRGDIYLFEHGLGERCITAKLGCHMHAHLPVFVKDPEAKIPANLRLDVDCEYDRFGDDRKWFEWDLPIVDVIKKEMYYTPIPDIIIHHRSDAGPNLLVVEAKKHAKANEFTALIDRIKLIGYLGPNLNNAYGMYLSLGHADGKLALATAELIEFGFVRKANDEKEGKALWKKATKLVENELHDNGSVHLFRQPDKAKKEQAGEVCADIVKQFRFEDVRKDLVAEAK